MVCFLSYLVIFLDILLFFTLIFIERTEGEIANIRLKNIYLT